MRYLAYSCGTVNVAFSMRLITCSQSSWRAVYANVAWTVTSEAGIVNVRMLPEPSSVTDGVADIETNSYPSDGVAISLTVVPACAVVGLADMLPPE